MIPNSPWFIKHSSVVMTQRLNVIYKNRLHNFLLRLERSTCVQEKSKQKRNKKLCMDYCHNGSSTLIGSLRSVSHFTPPTPPLTLDKLTCIFSRISYDRPPNGRVQYRMTVATVGTDSHDPPSHCTLPPPPTTHLHKHLGDDCFQVTTWPPENAHWSSPCIYPHVK